MDYRLSINFSFYKAYQKLESKLVPGVYFCGEVMDIDGFCGGFNLQNCWSTGYIATQSI
jgi:predicted flavoprotein YhiN